MGMHRDPPLERVRALLEAADLPSPAEGEMIQFMGCGPVGDPCGVIGVELYGRDALLRSLVVTPECRGRGCARALVAGLEEFAKARTVERMYLLTEAAKEFFEHQGYQVVPRDSAPDAMRDSREFAALCPASAVCMSKGVGATA